MTDSTYRYALADFYSTLNDYAYPNSYTRALQQVVQDYGQPQTSRSSPTFTTDHSVTLDIAFLMADDVTVAQLTSPAPHNKVFRGAAKRHPDDTQNDSVGASLALARLLRNYADALEKESLRLSHL